MRVIIIGAGPCGLGAAYRLQEKGFTDFALYEQTGHTGGLATSFLDEKGYTWDFAVHVAHSHYHYVDALMDDLLPDGFYHHERRSWVREYGTYIPYPFQNNIRRLPREALWDCVEGLLALQNGTASAKPTNFREWILQAFGKGIADHFMIPYNRKIWSVDPSEMNCYWTGDRVPTVDLKRILENIILEKDDVAWGPNATFQFPKKGGTGAIWKELGNRIHPERLRLNTSLVDLDVDGKVATFSDGTVEQYDHLISTIPLPVLAGFTGRDELIGLAGRLKYTHVQVACIAPQQKIPDDLAEKTWLYCPEDKSAFYRVTPFSTFSPAHVPDVEKQCSFLCEISLPGGSGLRPDQEVISSTLDGLRDTGLIDCDPETTHTRVLNAEYGYPVPSTDRDEILNELVPGLEELGIYSRGRFGGWKYEVANMDHSLMQGVEAVDRILDDGKEITWATPGVANAPGKR